VRSRFVGAAVTLLGVTAACASGGTPETATDRPSAAVAVSAEPGERHLRDIRRLTNGGENAEAYFSADGRWLIFQATRDGRACDQQYVMRTDGSGLRRVSTGVGKTTCGYFIDGGRRIIFASTHHADTSCPPRPDYSRGYVWPLSPFDLYTADPDGSDLRRLTSFGAYTAEATLSPDGRSLVFTSTRDGDLDLYTMHVDGSALRRLTTTPGYDGGAFFSPDGSRIVYRAWHPADSGELADYRGLLDRGLVRPGRMEIWIMNADGSAQRQVTALGGANFAPFFTPDGRRIIFASNHEAVRTNPRSRDFDLYLVNLDGTGLERVTTSPEFDSFPMFSPDGRHLVWASNRAAANPGETNIFIAEWVE
jgi:Tol biopolymer transport system component